VGRKSKEQIAKEENAKKSNSKTKWIVIEILIATLLVFVIGKMGSFGNFISNLLTYLFGTLYVVPLLSTFAYGIYRIFFVDRLSSTIRIIIGFYVLNAMILLLGSFISQDITNFNELGTFALDGIKKIALVSPFNFTGGLLGGLLYSALLLLIDRSGVLITIIVMGVISLILIVPAGTYSNFVNGIKEEHEQKKALKQEEKERQLAENERLEEERRLKLAEEISKQNEIEEQQRANFINDEEPLVQEEPVFIKKKRDDVLSKKSQYFINLDEDELSTPKEDKVLNSEDVVKSATDVAPRVLKPVRGKTNYKLPPLSLLNNVRSSNNNINKTSAQVKGEKVIEILRNFGIEASLVNTHIGPSVTKFEIKPDSSIQISRIQNISDNIKMELAAKEIRIEAPIPGRSAVGIEIPNVEPVAVPMHDLMSKIPKNLNEKKLLFALGKDLMGKETYCDLEKMPHLLIAGATGSGKSVCENAIITSFIMRSNPDNLKLVLVDPKKVEFTPYHDIPHLLWPVITDATMASNMLKKIVVIMEERYDAFSEVSVKNIQGFNEFVDNYNEHLEKDQTPMNRLPHIVIVIDELADMMAVAGKDVEMSIQRITQLARASGIHLIVATQRPSTDVITGLIKANMPSRISFALTSQIDSRTIIDQSGAEKLLGKGDMLYKPQDENSPIRLQGVYVTDDEVRKICDYVKAQAKPEYEDSYFEFLTNMSGSSVMGASSVNADTMDSLYDDVVEYVKEAQKASTSLLQRRFGIGYNRAARLIDTLEDRGIIGPSNGSKPREVYVKNDDEA